MTGFVTRGGSIAPSILKLAEPNDAVLVVQSFSKAWCMTGWRLGWLISRPDLCARAAQFNEFTVSHAPSISQKAGETALAEGEPFVEELLVRLRENRDYCTSSAGIDVRGHGPCSRRRILPFSANRRADR